MNLIPIIGMVLSLLVLPGMTFGFIYFLRKGKLDVDKLKYQKEILELELRRDELKLKTLSEENRKYDNLLEDRISKL